MAKAILLQILEKTQELLQAQTWTPETGDTMKTIDDDAIVIRKSLSVNKKSPRKTDEKCPGIIITYGPRAMSPAEAGTNTHDDVMYTILLQIIANDSGGRLNDIGTLLKWQQTARRAMAAENFTNTISGSDGCVYHGTSVVTDHLDARRWQLYENFWGGVECRFWAREPRS